VIVSSPGTVYLGRSAGNCGSWVKSQREDEAGGSRGLVGHLLKNVDKGSGEVRGRRRIQRGKKQILAF